MITELVLPQDRFSKTKLSDIKKKTFIFGKNGTGKSSIVECIKKQYANEYEIKVFQGYEQIIADYGKLDLIALGVENVEIQKQIKELEPKIKELEAELEDTLDGKDNLKKRYNQQENVVTEAEKEITEFYKKSASEIKVNNRTLVDSNYNKNDFERNVNNLEEFSEKEVDEAYKIYEQRDIKIEAQNEYSLDKINKLVKTVNKILLTEVIESIELVFNSTKERIWVQDGISLHKETECCLYCGAKLTKARKLELNNYFNDTVNQLNAEILMCEKLIEEEKIYVKELPSIRKEQFLLTHEKKVNELNEKLISIKDKAYFFLDDLQKKLQYKKENLFLPCLAVKVYEQKELELFGKEYKELYKTNYDEVNRLSILKEQAKVIIRNYLVAERCRAFNHVEKKSKLQAENVKLKELKEELGNKQEDLDKLREDVKTLQLQTVDEGKAAEFINKAIQGLGNQSFTLEKSEKSGEKGAYIVRDYSGEIRRTETLSTGEKNIVAFLWFIHNLKNLNNQSAREKVIIFDDPMNSNDDTAQYLIISELQNLLNSSDSQIFILTHNAHFYINTRYQWWRKDKQNKVTIRLIKRGNTSDVILINNEDSDIKTSYDGLWSEVKWLYEQDKPDYMLNPIRRILETYKKFNCIDDLFGGNKEAEKLFNVNSHSIDDLENDPNGKNRDEIIELVKKIFIKHRAEEHFKAHWEESVD
ncbi:AAA family ATPase [Veillonella sp. VA137]|uniref:AAA family ATPase n=1 Tax=Veillonella sp. VA137 TaxID=741828 RepID=UPI000F8E0DF9|nr:AAA family ATPase [Veillonella sp. VA137]